MPETQTHVPQSEPKKFNFWRWFWLTFLVVSLGWAWHDFYAPGNKVSWAKDYPTAQKESAQSGKPMLVFFTGTWCVPCRIMKREVWADHEVENTVNAKFVPVMIEVDDPKAAATVSEFKIGVTPTTVVIDPKGKVVQYVVGGLGKADFVKWLGPTLGPG